MSDARLAPGSVLGGRFEVHGVVGRGGTATVVLATDRLRSERVALKVIHPHLASDPAVRRRLQREVHTASVLRSPAALVPHDLHEFDGLIALSLPFYPGQTLAERVATGGWLPADEIRALGVRLAGALGDAHRAGVLHRDVTPNNVLIYTRADGAVLTDFGLSRLLGAARSTGLLGTAGYAAPEVYAGERADPRSDLYGLGAVLYLAATGRPAFDPSTPAAALKQQLDGTFAPIRELRPDCPPDLARTIESLLAPDPAARPQGAQEVADALTRKEPFVAPAPAVAKAAPLPEGAGALPRGSFGVLVRERNEDHRRRDRLRRAAAGAAPQAEDEILRWGTHLVGQVRQALGVPAAPSRTPEEALVAAVAREGKVPEDGLRQNPVIFERSLWLVEGTDRDTAERLASTARSLGFRARAQEIVETNDFMRMLWAAYVTIMVSGWITMPALSRFGSLPFYAVLLFTVIVPILLGQLRDRTGRTDLGRHPVAYGHDLHQWLASGLTAAAPAAQPASEPARTRGEALAERTRRAIAALEAAASGADLPEVALADLKRTAAELRQRADTLAADIDRIEAELRGASSDETALAALRSRLDRLETLAQAGETVDPAERARIQRALDAAVASQDAADRLEAQLASSTARLIEISSTADRARRELLLEPEPARSADDLVRKLRQESRAAADAQRETRQRLSRQATRIPER